VRYRGRDLPLARRLFITDDETERSVVVLINTKNKDSANETVDKSRTISQDTRYDSRQLLAKSQVILNISDSFQMSTMYLDRHVRLKPSH
jgi:hypothetical protein